MAETDGDGEELQNPDNWDLEGAERRPPVKRARAVVSVAFRRDDFDRVVELAEGRDITISEFIRAATLEQVLAAAIPTHIDVAASAAWTNARWGWLPEHAEDVASSSAMPATT